MQNNKKTIHTSNLDDCGMYDLNKGVNSEMEKMSC